MKITKLLFVILVFALALSSCSEIQISTKLNKGEDLTHIRLPMGYIPSVQYAPFYVADKNGFFEEAGLALEFDYSFETDGVKLVAANELQFSLASGEQILLARAEGLPIVYVLGWYKDYPIAVVSKKEAGIQTPADLAGKRIGIPGPFGASYVGFRALLDQAGLKESDVILDSIGFNQVEALATDRVDAAVVYVNNEPYQLQNLGYEVHVIAVADYAHLVSNGIITNETTIRENPDLVRRMVQAVIRGIKYTVTHPVDAYDDCEDYIEGLPEIMENLRKAEVERYAALYQTDPYGYIDLASWENMQEILIKMELISEPLDLTAAFTNDFIK